MCNASDAADVVERCSRFVLQSVRPFPLADEWLPAGVIARHRMGDCKSTSTLLAAMLRARGMRARVVVGMVFLGGRKRLHAWVEVDDGGMVLVCDPGVETRPLSREEYASRVMGYADLTAEYLALAGHDRWSACLWLGPCSEEARA